MHEVWPVKLDEDGEVEQCVICVEWGKQSLPATKFPCYYCGVDLALSNGNVDKCKEVGMAAACMDCATKRPQGGTFAGGMTEGKLTQRLSQAAKEAVDAYHRLNKHAGHIEECNDETCHNFTVARLYQELKQEN